MREPGNYDPASVDRTSPKPAHTPGPWLAGKPSSVVGWPVVAPAALGRLIANISYAAHSPTDPKVPGDDAFNRESAANARLIAASPVMAEVLNYVADMTYCGADAEWHFKPGYDPQRVLDAITKAGGAA